MTLRPASGISRGLKYRSKRTIGDEFAHDRSEATLEGSACWEKPACRMPLQFGRKGLELLELALENRQELAQRRDTRTLVRRAARRSLRRGRGRLARAVAGGAAARRALPREGHKRFVGAASTAAEALLDARPRRGATAPAAPLQIAEG